MNSDTKDFYLLIYTGLGSYLNGLPLPSTNKTDNRVDYIEFTIRHSYTNTLATIIKINTDGIPINILNTLLIESFGSFYQLRLNEQILFSTTKDNSTLSNSEQHNNNLINHILPKLSNATLHTLNS